MPNDCEILLRWRQRSHQTVHLLVLSFVMYIPTWGRTHSLFADDTNVGVDYDRKKEK